MYIAQLLDVTYTFQVLDIESNNIEDDGMAVISKALEHKRSLAKLWVAECGLSVKGMV